MTERGIDLFKSLTTEPQHPSCKEEPWENRDWTSLSKVLNWKAFWSHLIFGFLLVITPSKLQELWYGKQSTWGETPEDQRSLRHMKASSRSIQGRIPQKPGGLWHFPSSQPSFQKHYGQVNAELPRGWVSMEEKRQKLSEGRDEKIEWEVVE